MVAKIRQKLVECGPLQEEADHKQQYQLVRRKWSKISNVFFLTPADLLGVIASSCGRMHQEQL